MITACSSSATGLGGEDELDGGHADGSLSDAGFTLDSTKGPDGTTGPDGTSPTDTSGGTDGTVGTDTATPGDTTTGVDTPATDGGPVCGATIAGGAVPLTTNYLAASVIGSGGYAYAFDDKIASTACLASTALCAKGSTGVATSTGTVWGAGIGLNLHQAMATGPTSPPVETFAATGVGIRYSLSNLPPQGMRLIIDNAGTDYCAAISATSGTVTWGSFNTKCWDNSGTYLTGAPATAKHIQFQVTAFTAVTAFDFCVTSIAFATTGPTDAGVDTASVDTGTGGAACTWSGGPPPGPQLTCYYFGQGTSTGGGCPSFKTYCGYCGTESGSVGAGACPAGINDSVANTGTGTYFAALAGPGGAFGAGKFCGACVDVTYGGTTITATVIDACATCVGGLATDLDLSLSAARALGIGVGTAGGHPTTGVTWKTVSCPVTGNVVAQYNAGYAGQIYFQNVRFPVASATAGGTTGFQANGYWDFGASAAGKSVTLKDTLGHTITGTIPSSSGGSIGAQFPASCP